MSVDAFEFKEFKSKSKKTTKEKSQLNLQTQEKQPFLQHTFLFSFSLDARFKSRRCCSGLRLRWQNEEERRRGVLGMLFVSS